MSSTRSSPAADWGHRPIRLRFSLRTAILAVTLACVWLGITSYRANRQRRAVTAMVPDGTVCYDFQVDENGSDALPRGAPRPQPPGPTWLRELIGLDYFARVVGVDFYVKIRGDGSIAALANLPQLPTLTLHGPGVTGSVVARVSNAHQLHHLCRYDNSIAVESSNCLDQFIHLRALSLGGSNVTDATIEHVARLDELVELHIVACPVTDVDIKCIERLRNLRFLDVRGIGATAGGIAGLKEALPGAQIISDFRR
jgi:hypothetical protein